jgi:CBS-domain-containing membrane protein
MERHRGKRIPIVEDGRLIGVVSRANLVQARASVPTHVGETIKPDRVIRTPLLSASPSSAGPTSATET